MITVADLRRLARARLRDAKSLLRAKRFDGAIYIGGYVVEIGLKARICRTLRIKTNHLAEWSAIGTWDPEVRYRKVGSATKADAELLVSSAEILLKAL